MKKYEALSPKLRDRIYLSYAGLMNLLIIGLIHASFGPTSAILMLMPLVASTYLLRPLLENFPKNIYNFVAGVVNFFQHILKPRMNKDQVLKAEIPIKKPAAPKNQPAAPNNGQRKGNKKAVIKTNEPKPAIIATRRKNIMDELPRLINEHPLADQVIDEYFVNNPNLFDYSQEIQDYIKFRILSDAENIDFLISNIDNIHEIARSYPDYIANQEDPAPQRQPIPHNEEHDVAIQLIPQMLGEIEMPVHVRTLLNQHFLNLLNQGTSLENIHRMISDAPALLGIIEAYNEQPHLAAPAPAVDARPVLAAARMNHDEPLLVQLAGVLGLDELHSDLLRFAIHESPNELILKQLKNGSRFEVMANGPELSPDQIVSNLNVVYNTLSDDEKLQLTVLINALYPDQDDNEAQLNFVGNTALDMLDTVFTADSLQEIVLRLQEELNKREHRHQPVEPEPKPKPEPEPEPQAIVPAPLQFLAGLEAPVPAAAPIQPIAPPVVLSPEEAKLEQELKRAIRLKGMLITGLKKSGLLDDDNVEVLEIQRTLPLNEQLGKLKAQIALLEKLEKKDLTVYEQLNIQAPVIAQAEQPPALQFSLPPVEVTHVAGPSGGDNKTAQKRRLNGI